MKQKPVYKGVEFDSREEIEFYMWLEEAFEHELITGSEYQPKSYCLSKKQTRMELKQLKTKKKRVEKHLLHPHKYTADFRFGLTRKGKEIALPFIYNEVIEEDYDELGKIYFRHYNAVVDIKGSFNQHGGDREFSINQKWVFDKYGVYINKVVPEKLFKATWCPAEARLTEKTKQVKKKYEKCKTIQEFMENER
jgi:hypothetical protein